MKRIRIMDDDLYIGNLMQEALTGANDSLFVAG